MAYPDLSDSERGHRYPQHLTSGDSADRPRSNSMSDTTNSDQGQTGTGSSYVHVERSDVESYQNSLYAGQLDYSESSASWGNLQSGSSGQNVASRDAAGGQHTDCTRWFEPGWRRSPYQISTMYAGPSDYNPHTQYAAPIGLPSQGLAFIPNHGSYGTQPLYNLQDDIRQTYPALTQGDDTMSPYRAAFGQVPDGRWSTVYQQAERRQHLDQQVNHLMDVLDPAGVQAIARSSGYASDTSSISFDDVDDQDWGEASVATIRPENGPQNAPVDYSNGSQYPHPLADQVRFHMPPNRAVVQPARQTSLAIRSHPRMASTRNNSHGAVPPTVCAVPISSNPTPPDVIQCSFCSNEYTGRWRKTNRDRHERHKHRGQSRESTCHVCDQTFQRSDARLKHQRRRHPELFQGGL